MFIDGGHFTVKTTVCWSVLSSISMSYSSFFFLSIFSCSLMDFCVVFSKRGVATTMDFQHKSTSRDAVNCGYLVKTCRRHVCLLYGDNGCKGDLICIQGNFKISYNYWIAEKLDVMLLACCVHAVLVRERWRMEWFHPRTIFTSCIILKNSEKKNCTNWKKVWCIYFKT